MQQNLARAWRSKTFEEMIGQELSVRLLKNSLAKNRLFPVYLFSGLRGSGKTSSGRIFAAALNCEHLPLFQKDQTVQVPCLKCASCTSMRLGKHPDFVEIDAASHTGVDNVRQIIESASFLPVMGRKKIYLIDEAHMLSKAAFNAFLKILEEPPASVIFLLATTEAHKILDTVKSRCFHIFFDPIAVPQLTAHLAHICTVENIEFQEAACALIARQSEGSVRDALTIMERIILAEGAVTVDGVHRTLGLLRDDLMIKLFEVVAQGSLPGLLDFIASHLSNAAPALVWDGVIMTFRGLLWEHAAAQHRPSNLDVSSLRMQYPAPLVLEFFDLFYRAEPHFLRTTSQHALLESLLCKMTQRFGKSVEQVDVVMPRVQHAALPSVDEVEVKKPQQNTVAFAWQQFMYELEQGKNPIATSIFKQGTFAVAENGLVRVQFAKKFEFYYEWIFANEQLWRPALDRAFGNGVLLTPEFIAADTTAAETVHVEVAEKKSPPTIAQGFDARPLQKSTARVAQEKIDMSDAQVWRVAHLVKQTFPGTITVRKE